MVRSKSSCLKMLTCGAGDDSVDNRDLQHSDIEEGKSSMDKHGWSFRKRSTRHRVLSKSVISSETPSSRIKDASEALTTTDSYPANTTAVPQKMSMSQWMEETPSLPTSVTAKVANQLVSKKGADKIDPLVSTELVQNTSSTITTENTSKISHNLEEASAIIIQASIRGYLAQRSLLKLKNIIKLQAAFRGHLERRHALGTLRCVQAIVKMQALVRARRAHILLKGSVTDEKNENISHSHITLGMDQTGLKAIRNYSSTQKLLNNGFARQLLESAPKKNRIHIRCDPSKSDSAWKWLERWVSVSPDFPRAQKLGRGPGHGGISGASEVESENPMDVVSHSMALKHKLTVQALAPEYDENLITYDADNFKFQACHLSPSSPSDVTLKPQFDGVDFIKAQNTFSTDDTSQVPTRLDATSQALSVSVPNKPEDDSEQLRRPLGRVASEQPETEGKKVLSVSTKACSHAFAAVQSKFEVLSSSGISGRSNSSSQVGEYLKFDGVSASEESGTRKKENSLAENLISHEPRVRVEGSDCGTELSISSTLDSPDRKKENSLAENLISHEPRVRVEGSDCGTELSISSTLDSPDRYDIGGMEFEHEREIVEKTTTAHKATTNGSEIQNLDVEPNNCSVSSESDSSYTTSQQVKLEDVKGETFELSLPVNSAALEQQPERCASEVQVCMESPTKYKVHNRSLAGSPISHITIPEKDGTPPSQVCVKANNDVRSDSSQRRKSLSASKKFPSNPSHDTSARSSTDQLPRDSRYGKRQISIGLSKPDQVDQDPRHSISSLPSYMQATESARAKALANSSPRSSPDLQEKDISVKKRHSLPGANVKQVSPRIQRSMSQAQGAKGNETRNQDRTWQR